MTKSIDERDDDARYGRDRPYFSRHKPDSFDFELLAKRLKEARARTRLSTEDIARVLSREKTPDYYLTPEGKREPLKADTVSASTIRRIENRNTPEPSLKTMVKLAAVFECPVAAFFDRTADYIGIDKKVPRLFSGLPLRQPGIRVDHGRMRRAQKTIAALSLWVGKRIQVRREYLGRSVYELALDADISTTMLQKYEDGSRYPSWESLDRLGRALDVDPVWFLDFF